MIANAAANNDAPFNTNALPATSISVTLYYDFSFGFVKINLFIFFG